MSPVGTVTDPVPGNTGLLAMLIVGLAEPSPPTTVICDAVPTMLRSTTVVPPTTARMPVVAKF